MAYGFEVYNSFGNIQVSSSTINYALVAKTSVFFPFNGTANTWEFDTDITIPGYTYQASDIIMVNTGHVDNYVTVKGNYSTGGVSCFAWMNGSSSNIVIEIYRQTPSSTVSDDYGLEVYNDNGDLVYSYNYTPFKIATVLSATATTVGSITGLDVPFICSNSILWQRASILTSPARVEYYAVSASNTTATLGFRALSGAVISYTVPGTMTAIVTDRNVL